MATKLQKLGRHDLSTSFTADYTSFKEWLAANAVVAMDACHDHKPWPAQPPKPTA